MQSRVARAVATDVEALAAIARADVFDVEMRRAIRNTYLKLRRQRYLKRAASPARVAEIIGARMHYLDNSTFEYLFREIFVGLEYQFVSPTNAPRIIDCGSNIGMSLLFFKKLYPEASILAFEPGDLTYQTLLKNIQANGWSNVTALQQAVSETEGTMDLYYDENQTDSLRMSIVSERNPGKASRPVKVVRLSSFIDGPVDMLKLDVEGAEMGVMRDLQNTGAIAQIKEMMIEYHHHIDNASDNLSVFLRILEDSGFGYQIRAAWDVPFQAGGFQDIMIRAYRRT
ncbi:MAG: FkbM family methyltransferase [Gemmatimonas sp.]